MLDRMRSGFVALFTAKRKQPIGKHSKLEVERLEDRWVPSGTPTVNLTAADTIGGVNGAIFRTFEPQPTGTGVINSFVRVQTANGKATVEQGYNTDARPLQLDENNSPQFTRSLQLSSVPTVNIAGKVYREFLLDINQKNSAPLLSLDQLRIYVGGAGDLTGYDAGTQQLAGLCAVYDLDAGGDHWVALNARLSHGSGSGDMLVYVPDAVFTGGSYVYLYSKFGENVAANGGFEEWAVGASALTADNTASLAGHVLNDANHTGLANVETTLTLTDALGNTTTFSTTTDTVGVYDFTNLFAGNYSVSAGLASGFNYDGVTVGTVDGSPDGTASGTHSITNIVLDDDDDGINYDFSEHSAQTNGTINVLLKLNGYGIPDTFYVTVFDSNTNTSYMQMVSPTATGGNVSVTLSFTMLPLGDNYTVSITDSDHFTPVGSTNTSIVGLSGTVQTTFTYSGA